EATELRRELAEAEPDAFLPALVSSLSRRSFVLADLGRYDEALDVVEEAVGSSRRLVARDRGAFLPDLARSLINQANLLGDVERYDQAYAALEEAVGYVVELGEDAPEQWGDHAKSMLQTYLDRAAE